jgi:NADH dehydrogenase FAD-containing subunit
MALLIGWRGWPAPARGGRRCRFWRPHGRDVACQGAGDITLIDRENHHLFQRPFYQLATAGLSPTKITCLIRCLVWHQRNTRVRLGGVTGVERARKHVVMCGRNTLYDALVLATGETWLFWQ